MIVWMLFYDFGIFPWLLSDFGAGVEKSKQFVLKIVWWFCEWFLVIFFVIFIDLWVFFDRGSRSLNIFWRFVDDFLSDVSWFLNDCLWFLSDFGPGVEKSKQFFWRIFDDFSTEKSWFLIDFSGRAPSPISVSGSGSLRPPSPRQLIDIRPDG